MKKNESHQLTVRKANRLVEASYKLTLQEQRIILLLASMINSTDEAFHVYRIAIKEFIELTQVKGKSKYEEIKQITKKLRERTLIIQTDNSELQIGWLSSSEYFTGAGYVELCFDPKLKPFLLRIKDNFTPYLLKNVITLKSAYSIRLYELLKQYQKIGERRFELDKLKNILGIKPDEYKLYANFKQKILNPAKKELKEKTDLSFSFKEKKQARKVAEIYFFIKTTQEKEQQQQPPDDINIELYIRLQDYFCLSPALSRQLLTEYPESRILENLQYVEKRHKSGQVKDLGAYTIKAITEDFKDQLSLFDVEKQQKEKEKTQQEAQKQLTEHLKAEYHAFRHNEHEKLRASLSGAKLKEIKDLASIEAKEKAGKKKFGLALHQRLVEERLLDKEGNLPSENEWIEQEKTRYKKVQK
jgi:plasmid replication initiation protein